MPRTLVGEWEGLLREIEEGLAFGGPLIWLPASFLAASLAVLLTFVGMGDLALVFSRVTLFPDWENLFPDVETLFPAGEAAPFLGTWQGAGGAFVVPVGLVGVPVASFWVLRLRGSLVVPPGVLRVGVGIFEIPPEILRGGVGKLGRPVAVAPLTAVPSLAVPPPWILLTGTGSLDFQACLVPVPQTCPGGGGTATPPCSGVPANLLAVGRERECLPVAATAIVVGAMSILLRSSRKFFSKFFEKV